MEPELLPAAASPTTRRSYTATFKLSVVRELTSTTSPPSVRSLAQRHGITPSMVRKWLASKVELEAAVALDSAGDNAHGTAKLRKLGSGRRPGHRTVDEALLAWIRSQRALGEVVKDKDMQARARALALEQGIANFRASKGYICNFKSRNSLSTATPGGSGRGTKRQRRTVSSTTPAAAAGSCLFGMDIGMATVKCAVVCASTGSILATSSAAIFHPQNPELGGGSDLQVGEQSVASVLLAAQRAVRTLPMTLRQQIRSIGICGVMHGIVWWRCDSVRKAVDELLAGDSTPNAMAYSRTSQSWSQYVTFMDQRCTPAFLAEWRAKIRLANTTTASFGVDMVACGSSPIASGYALATFAYMLERQPHDLVGFDACGTLQDLVAFALCGHSWPSQTCIDTTHAFSWGGFDLNTKTWNLRTVQALGIPAHMLPVVKAPGTIVGQSSNLDALLGLPNGKPIYLPMGDHPCSVMAAISQTQNLADGILSRTSVLNISSTTQLAMVLTSEDAAQLNSSMHEDGSNSPSFEVRPFLFDNWFLGVAASLSGGNIFAWFVKQCQAWSRQLAADPTLDQLPEQAMYARLISLGGTKLDTDLEFLPTLNGEWAAPAMRGRIQQLRMTNWSVGDISAAICRGLLDNIFAMVPDELRDVLPSQPMIGAGRAMVHNALLQHFLAEKLEHPTQLTIQDAADAAVGVAFAPSLLQK